MRRAIVLLATLTLTSLNACELFTGPELTIQVQGTVTAADDGSSIVGALAGVWDPCFMGPCGFHDRDTTDASGHYSLSFVLAKCHPATLGLSVTHLAFVGMGLLFNGPHITCTEELQIIDGRLARLPT